MKRKINTLMILFAMSQVATNEAFAMQRRSQESTGFGAAAAAAAAAAPATEAHESTSFGAAAAVAVAARTKEAYREEQSRKRQAALHNSGASVEESERGEEASVAGSAVVPAEERSSAFRRAAYKAQQADRRVQMLEVRQNASEGDGVNVDGDGDVTAAAAAAAVASSGKAKYIEQQHVRREADLRERLAEQEDAIHQLKSSFREAEAAKGKAEAELELARAERRETHRADVQQLQEVFASLAQSDNVTGIRAAAAEASVRLMGRQTEVVARASRAVSIGYANSVLRGAERLSANVNRAVEIMSREAKGSVQFALQLRAIFDRGRAHRDAVDAVFRATKSGIQHEMNERIAELSRGVEASAFGATPAVATATKKASGSATAAAEAEAEARQRVDDLRRELASVDTVAAEAYRELSRLVSIDAVQHVLEEVNALKVTHLNHVAVKVKKAWLSDFAQRFKEVFGALQTIGDFGTDKLKEIAFTSMSMEPWSDEIAYSLLESVKSERLAFSVLGSFIGVTEFSDAKNRYADIFAGAFSVGEDTHDLLRNLEIAREALASARRELDAAVDAFAAAAGGSPAAGGSLGGSPAARIGADVDAEMRSAEAAERFSEAQFGFKSANVALAQARRTKFVEYAVSSGLKSHDLLGAIYDRFKADRDHHFAAFSYLCVSHFVEDVRFSESSDLESTVARRLVALEGSALFKALLGEQSVAGTVEEY